MYLKGKYKCPISKTKISLKYCFSRFEFSQEQFVDLCILLGCDYVDKIKGVGPKKAIELVSSCFYTYLFRSFTFTISTHR